MATILPPDNSSLSYLLGKDITSGLAQGLSGMLDRSNTRKGLEPIFGRQKAQQLSGLSPEMLKTIIPQEYQKLQQQEAMQQFASQMPDQQAAPDQQGAPDQQAGQGPLSALQAQQGVQWQAQQTPLEQIQQALQAGLGQQGPSIDTAPNLQPPSGPESEAQIAPNLQPPSGPKSEEQQAKESVYKQLEQQKNTLDEYGYTSGQTAMQALMSGKSPDKAFDNEQTARREAQKALNQDRSQIRKETQPFYKKTIQDSRQARNSLSQLNKMEQLAKKGKLTPPAISAFLDVFSKGVGGKFGIGYNMDALKKPESQEYKRLRNQFISDQVENMPNASKQKIQTIFDKIPSLNDRNVNKLKIISDLKNLEEAKLIRHQAMSDIIKKNGGRRPENLEDLVETMVEPKINELTRQFNRSENTGNTGSSGSSQGLSSLFKRIRKATEPSDLGIFNK